jgi:hypothetical protein
LLHCNVLNARCVLVEPEAPDAVQLLEVDESLPADADAVHDHGGVQVNLRGGGGGGEEEEVEEVAHCVISAYVMARDNSLLRLPRYIQ